MSLKKRIYAIIILVAVLAGVFYVGKSGIQLRQEEQKESFLKNSKKKDTLQFWYTDEALTDYLNAAAVSYYETYGTRVELTLMPQTEVLEAINAAILDDEVQTPDLYMITNDSLEKAYLAGLASEITNPDLLNDAERFAETAKAAVTYKDKMVAYPFYYETCAILYNKTYLEEFAQKQMQAEIDQAAGEASQAEAEAGNVEEEGKAQTTDVVFTQEQIAERVKTYMPTTVDTLIAFSDSYDAPENVEGIFKWDVSDILYNYSFAGCDMSIGGINGDDATLVDIYNPSTIKCLTMFQELNQYFFIETKNADYETVIQDFIDGKLVFTVANTDIINRMNAAKENGSFAYEYGLTHMPDLTDGLERCSRSITMTVAVNGYSEQRQKANNFAKYLVTDQTEGLHARTGKLPAYKKTCVVDDITRVFYEEYEKSVPMPKMMTTGNFWVQMEIAFTEIWEGGNVDEILKELSDNLMKQMNEESQ